MDQVYIYIAFIFLLPGLIGVIVPIIPGIPYMLIISLAYGFLTKFHMLNTKEIVLLAIIAAASLFVDYLTGILGAKYGGTGKKSLLWGIIGSVVGSIVMPPFGGITGLFVGIMSSELLNHSNSKKALRAASGGVLGSLAGIIINLFLAITFLVCFLVFTLR